MQEQARLAEVAALDLAVPGGVRAERDPVIAPDVFAVLDDAAEDRQRAMRISGLEDDAAAEKRGVHPAFLVAGMREAALGALSNRHRFLGPQLRVQHARAQQLHQREAEGIVRRFAIRTARTIERLVRLRELAEDELRLRAFLPCRPSELVDRACRVEVVRERFRNGYRRVGKG